MTSSCNLPLNLVYGVTSTCTDYDAFLHHYCMCIYTMYERNLILLAFLCTLLSLREIFLLLYMYIGFHAIALFAVFFSCVHIHEAIELIAFAIIIIIILLLLCA